MLQLNLVPIESSKVRGIYTVHGIANRMPDRCLYLSSAAAQGYDAIADKVTITDMYRSPESSLEAEQRKGGVQPPGFSGHGLPANCIDLDVDKTLHANRWTKNQLDDFMESRGWVCFRSDHQRGSEDWHYGFGIRGWVQPGEHTTERAQERFMVSIYGAALQPSRAEAQAMLAKLHLYHGELDGLWGPISRTAIAVFQRAWLVERTYPHKIRQCSAPNAVIRAFVFGQLDPVTARMLAFVSADHVVTPAPSV